MDIVIDPFEVKEQIILYKSNPLSFIPANLLSVSVVVIPAMLLLYAHLYLMGRLCTCYVFLLFAHALNYKNESTNSAMLGFFFQNISSYILNF